MKFKSFKEEKIVVKRIEYNKKGGIRQNGESLGDAMETSVTVALDGLSNLEIAKNSEFLNKSWGTVWVSTFSPEEFLALKKLINGIEVEEEEK